MRKWMPFVALICAMLACTLGPQENTTPPTAVVDPTASPEQQATPTQATVQHGGEPLPEFSVDLSRPFGGNQLTRWEPFTYAGVDYELPLTLSEAANKAVLDGLTHEQRLFLSENGFVVVRTEEQQFNRIRVKVSERFGQPYYLTTDAAFHALHLTFDETIKALEREQLQPRMIYLVKATLDETLSYLPALKGTSLESDSELAAAYLAVALKLLDPTAEVPLQFQDAVRAQVEQIEAGGGRAKSTLIPDFEDDYGAYKPVSHYAGDAGREAYFRGMTWLGRVHFPLTGLVDGAKASRAPLVITLALRKAQVADLSSTGGREWGKVHELLTFLVGPSDDSGPLEYAALMDKIYGTSPSLADLADDTLWLKFQNRANELPAPRINSTFVSSLAKLDETKGWRFLGQRFTLDGFILQNLVYDKVGTQDNPRLLPSGLDVMAAFGSQEASQSLEDAGAMEYENYAAQLATLQQGVAAQEEADWLGTFYNIWLYAFLPQVMPKDDRFPNYMRNTAWGYKEMNSALGSWTELKHDTALYAKMPEGVGGGGPPGSGPAPGYVEPNPQVFYRMAHAVAELDTGLRNRFMSEGLVEPVEGDFTYGAGLYQIVDGLQSFAVQLKELGDIAAKELQGTELTSVEWETIQACLGPVECRIEYMEHVEDLAGIPAPLKMPEVPVAVAVYGVDERILTSAVGHVDRIFVVVPIEGRMQFAQGGVYSYYEFTTPRSDRLTDEDWRQKLSGSPPDTPAWVDYFSFAGGALTDALAFRVGDWYKVTEAGSFLNMRDKAGRGNKIVNILQPGDYVEIVDGPVRIYSDMWWKVSTADFSNPLEGWILEDQTWFERAWGQ
jgi:hypothetical protein